MGDSILTLGKIVVIDLEATCWEGEPPVGQTSELIEVGVSMLTVPTLEISKPRRLFIKPIRSEVSPFCSSLTGITPELLSEKGKALHEVIDVLTNEFKLKERVWAGWGSDGHELIEAAGSIGMGKFEPSSYINLCSLFSVMTGSPNRVGLARALDMCGLEFKGIRHTGGDDSYNACRVLRWMIERIRSGMSASSGTEKVH